MKPRRIYCQHFLQSVERSTINFSFSCLRFSIFDCNTRTVEDEKFVECSWNLQLLNFCDHSIVTSWLQWSKQSQLISLQTTSATSRILATTIKSSFKALLHWEKSIEPRLSFQASSGKLSIIWEFFNVELKRSLRRAKRRITLILRFSQPVVVVNIFFSLLLNSHHHHFPPYVAPANRNV